MSRIHSVPREVHLDITARAATNRLPEWAVNFALILLEVEGWFHPNATDEDKERFIQYARENRSVLLPLMRFTKSFIMEPKNVEQWGNGSTRVVFSDQGTTTAHSLGINVGAIGVAIKKMILANMIGSVKEGELPTEDALLYCILPAVVGPISWQKPEDRIGMVDDAAAIYTASQAADRSGVRWGNDTGVVDYLGLLERTTVLYHPSGFVMNLRLNGKETAQLMDNNWYDIPWAMIFPGVSIIREERVEVRKPQAAPAPTEAVSEEAALPAIPEWVTEQQREALGRLFTEAQGGDASDALLEAQAALREAEEKANFLAEEARRAADAARVAAEEKHSAAADLETARRQFNQNAPVRVKARADYLLGIAAVNQLREAQMATNEILRIETDADEPAENGTH